MKDKKKKLYITFEADNKTFFAGRDAIGAVCLDTDENINVKKITIKFVGEGKVRFNNHDKNKNEKKFVEEKQTYLDKEFLLLNEVNSKFFTPGIHRFDFNFSLPSNLPSSFEGNYGNVNYYCKIKVEKTSFFSSKMDVKEVFYIKSVCDLQNDPKAMAPISKQLTGSPGIWCCRAGTFEFQLHIQQAGYLPGETIILNGSFNNQTSLSFDKSKIKLRQLVKYMAKGCVKSAENTILTHPIKLISSGEDFIFDNIPLQLPSLPPSGMPFCNMIDVQYSLMFKFNPKGFYKEHVMEVPISIGTSREPLQPEPSQPPLPTPVVYPPTPVAYPPTSVVYPPTSVGYPPTSVGYPPTSVGYPPTQLTPSMIIGHQYPPYGPLQQYPMSVYPQTPITEISPSTAVYSMGPLTPSAPLDDSYRYS